MSFTVEDAISEINSLYPPDADYEDTAKIGQQLLEQAKRDTSDWRNLPEATIFRLLQLNRDYDRWNAQAFAKKVSGGY